MSSWQPSNPSRRSTLGLIGAGAAATVWGTAHSAHASQALEPSTASAGHAVRLLLNGDPAEVGTYSFPTEVDEVVLDNGLVRFTFGRDDAVGGIVTGWSDVSVSATSVIVDGTELAHNLNGVEPRDPDRQHSFYVDAAGGKSRLVCSQVKVLRVSPDLVEVAFADTTGNPLRHEHHLIMRSGRRGLYGYDILSATADTSISEVRMNTRWDRSIFDHCFNWERGAGRQPTYQYLSTQVKLQDETWRVDGVDNPALPSPESNSGGLPAGYAYSKYEWSLYHHENPMFGTTDTASASGSHRWAVSPTRRSARSTASAPRTRTWRSTRTPSSSTTSGPTTTICPRTRWPRGTAVCTGPGTPTSPWGTRPPPKG
jgi:rhamnogalacturonan endolyase